MPEASAKLPWLGTRDEACDTPELRMDDTTPGLLKGDPEADSTTLVGLAVNDERSEPLCPSPNEMD